MRTPNTGRIMRVLVLPSFYPTKERQFLGVFFRELTLAARVAGVDAGVVYAEARSLRGFRLSALNESHFQVETRVEQGIPTVRRHGWNTLAQTRVGAELWIKQMESLARNFARRYGPPDIVHAHNALWAGVAAVRIAQTLGCRYVITEHSSALLDDDRSGEQRRQADLTYRGAARLICVSRALAASLTAKHGATSAVVIPNTVDAQFFSLPEVPRDGTRFVFSAIGNLTVNKAFDAIIHAFASRFAGLSDVRLEIGGTGPERSKLATLAQRLGVSDQVRFLGPLTRDQVRDAMWRANAFVLASRRETFGVVLVEALATGLPVIATRSGGPDDIITQDVGILVDSEDINALADAMEYVRQSRLFDSSVNRAYAVERFGHEVVGRALRSIYETCET